MKEKRGNKPFEILLGIIERENTQQDATNKKRGKIQSPHV